MIRIVYTHTEGIDSSGRARLESRITAATLRETASFGSDKVRLCRQVGEVMVLRGLERWYGLRRGSYQIRRAEKGKPYVEGVKGVYFNLSHSGDYVVCAFSDDEVGVDVEKIGKPYEGIVHRFFHPNEIKRWENATDDKSDLFYRIWVAKESYLKYLGTGLSQSLASFEVRPTAVGAALYGGTSLLPQQVTRIPIADGYACALCALPAEIVAPVRWDLSEM